MQRRIWIAAALAAATWVAGCATAPGPGRVLAPTGTLRIPVYVGSPTSLVAVAPAGEMRGVSVDIGRALAARLAVPSEVIVLQRVAEVVDALKSGRADFTITNATPARAAEVDFTPPLVGLELGFLVPAGSRIMAVDAIDRAGVRVGVSQGSTSQGTLGALLKQARVVPAPSLAAARELLLGGQLDAFATNKGILFELADRLPGARVLDGRWGLEQLAIAVPKGRDAALPWLRDFADDMQRSGRVRAAAERAGLRGTAAP